MKLELQHFNSLISLANHFNSDKPCRDFITEQRWHGEVSCPFCGCKHVYTCSNGDNQFKCAECHKRFSCLVGTIFQNTKLPLQKWFMAMNLISSHKKGISSHQLARDLDTCQKTAWFILHKVRTLFTQNDSNPSVLRRLKDAPPRLRLLSSVWLPVRVWHTPLLFPTPRRKLSRYIFSSSVLTTPICSRMNCHHTLALTRWDISTP